MSYSPRPALRPSVIRSLFESLKDPGVREARITMEVDADRELLPSSPGEIRDARATMEVVPERDLLPDEPLRSVKRSPAKRLAEDEHIVTTHVDIAELGTSHHPLSSPPTAHDVDPHHPRRAGGGWLIAAGSALLLGTIVFSARTPPAVNKPVSAAAAAAPPTMPVPPRSTTAPRDEHELAIRFALAREPGDVEAQRELALDPVYLTSPDRTGDRAPGKTSGKTSFDPALALSTIRNAGLGSAQCGEGAAGATVVSVTFAPSGRVTRALVEDGPLQGTAVGGCIARHLRNISVPAFEGEFQTVRTDLTLR